MNDLPKRKLRFDVNVPILATVRFTTMAGTILEAKADVCKRLAEEGVQSEMFGWWEHAWDEPDFEVQWDSIYCWISSGYHANVPAGSAEDLTEEELNQPILRPPGEQNARTDRERRLAFLWNETIVSNNNYLLLIANKLMEKDFEWLLLFAEQVIEDARSPDWNQPKRRDIDT